MEIYWLINIKGISFFEQLQSDIFKERETIILMVFFGNTMRTKILMSLILDIHFTNI